MHSLHATTWMVCYSWKNVQCATDQSTFLSLSCNAKGHQNRRWPQPSYDGLPLCLSIIPLTLTYYVLITETVYNTYSILHCFLSRQYAVLCCFNFTYLTLLNGTLVRWMCRKCPHSIRFHARNLKISIHLTQSFEQAFPFLTLVSLMYGVKNILQRIIINISGC